MADKKKNTVLPWGMSREALQPNSVKGISQSKIKAFNVGQMNPLKKSSQFRKKKDDGEKKKMMEAKETAEVFEEFVASFEETDSSGKTFVRGSSSVKAAPTGAEALPNPSGGSMYKPKSRFMQKPEEKGPKEEEKAIFPSNVKKPPKKKGAEKKKSILELFREELKRSQDGRRERQAKREATHNVQRSSPEPPPTAPLFQVEEYADMTNKGSFDNGDPLTTNLYVGNINPNMNEDNLCQLFGKFGPLASVKVMWPRTEEEKARKKNCGFVAYMKRQDAENALDHFKGTKIMEYEIQIGWGKSVRVPPQPVYVPPDKQEEENAKVPDPPSGLPFNAQTVIPVVKVGDGNSGNDRQASEHTPDEVYGDLFNTIVRVVVPTDVELLKVVHRMIEFVIREGPMFEAMIMNRELENPTYQFLFDNRSPAHIYYRWKLYSILQGDSPETWRIEEFRMFEGGSMWKPPPLKRLKSKVLPPVDDQIARRGQLSTRQRDELENTLRLITMEREKIKSAMVWCLDHSDSAEEISECICESLTINETPLPTKLARLYLVSDILVNCSSSHMDSMNFRREFEGKLLSIVEHFHMVMININSRIKREQFKQRMLKVFLVWDNGQVYHYNVVDKMRLTFIGKTTDDMEKRRAFDTVAALIGVGGGDTTGVEDKVEPMDTLDGIPLGEDRVLDFELGEDDLDGQPMENLDGEPLVEKEAELVPTESSSKKEKDPGDKESKGGPVVKSKWELVDYGDDSDESEEEEEPAQSAAALEALERQKLLAEVAERKRKILRDVEVKAMELYDALESSGSYSKEEIGQRVDKFRDKLMQEAVEPKFSPPRSKDKKGRSPSPKLDKYHSDISPSSKKKTSSQHDTTSSSRQKSPHSSRSLSRSRRRSPSSPTSSPVERKLYTSRSKRSRSKSPGGKWRSKSPISPVFRRSKSPISPASRRSKSWSPATRSQSTSPTPKRHSRRSQSPTSKSSAKSRSPVSGSGRSQSPLRRSRSRSPRKSSRRSKSPAPRSYRRSRSPVSRSRRSRSRSRSPARGSRSHRRSRSPRGRGSKHSRSPKRSRRSRSRSRSPAKRRSRSRSRSPAKRMRRSRSTERRSRSRSPARNSTSRRRSKSPKSSSKRRSSPSSSSKSSKKNKKRSRSRSPHKSKKKSKH